MSRYRYRTDEERIAECLAAGCLPVAAVLVEAGHPADLLERTDLIFMLPHWGGVEHATISRTLRPYVFCEPWLRKYFVKPHCRDGLLALVQAVLDGKLEVVRLGPWNQQVWDRHVRRLERAVAHKALMVSLGSSSNT